MPELVNAEQYDKFAGEVICIPGVRAADVIRDDPRLDRPCVELVIGPGYERVPPRVLRKVAEFDFGTRPDLSGSRGRPRHWTVVVVV